MELRRQVDTGHDPLEEAREEQAAPTIDDLITRYRLEHLPRKRPRSQAEDLSLTRQWIEPEFGNRRIADIKRSDVEKLHRKVSTRTPARANRLAALLSKMFSLTVRWEMIDVNPVTGLERNREETRERYLSGPELQRLVEVLADWPNQRVANLIRVLLLTGCRKSEALGMRWYRLPLSGAVRQLLIAIRASSTNSPFVFRGASASGHMVDPQRPWTAIRRAAQLVDLRLHDLRHSHASLAISSGSTLAIVGGLLGHQTPSVTMRYAHLLDHAARAATEKVSAIVGGAGEPAEVVKIRR
jgi:integrase